VAEGTERFLPLGSESEESPEKGEVIYFDDATHNVMCRRWNWRNGDATKIEATTKQLIINIDCLPPIARETADAARDELASLLQTHCDAQLATDCLHAERKHIDIDV
jgi:lysyl-tRNA synthetase class 2